MRAFRLVALSATVVAATPGAALGIDVGPPAPGMAVGAVRFEPLPGSDGLTVAGAGTYRGAIEVAPRGGGVSVVNDLALEDYVRGIDEVPPGWPAAALQAQAIAARTYAAHRALNGDDRWRAVGADICATPTCQVYRGLDGERRPGGQGWLAAVQATAGRALLEGGQPILASYSSTANGPRSMSQNGALEMAQAGRSAGDILVSYYGIPPAAAASRLPPTIRVALTMTSTGARIAGRFRVFDGAGAELAASADGGEWRVAPAGDGLRLVPPAGYRPTPAPTPPAEVFVAARSPGRAVDAVGTAHDSARPWAPAVAVLALAASAAGAVRGRRRRAPL